MRVRFRSCWRSSTCQQCILPSRLFCHHMHLVVLRVLSRSLEMAYLIASQSMRITYCLIPFSDYIQLDADDRSRDDFCCCPSTVPEACISWTGAFSQNPEWKNYMSRPSHSTLWLSAAVRCSPSWCSLPYSLGHFAGCFRITCWEYAADRFWSALTAFVNCLSQ